jgi:DNA-binding HxlR family transcriptional regulator
VNIELHGRPPSIEYRRSYARWLCLNRTVKNDSVVTPITARNPDDAAIPAQERLCPLIAFDHIVGGKYKLRTLWQLRNGPQRYSEIQRALVVSRQGQSITPRVLSRELKELLERRLIVRKDYAQTPPKVEYSLTPFGASLMPTLEEIVQWGVAGHHEEILRAASGPKDWRKA